MTWFETHKWESSDIKLEIKMPVWTLRDDSWAFSIFGVSTHLKLRNVTRFSVEHFLGDLQFPNCVWFHPSSVLPHDKHEVSSFHTQGNDSYFTRLNSRQSLPNLPQHLPGKLKQMQSVKISQKDQSLSCYSPKIWILLFNSKQGLQKWFLETDTVFQWTPIESGTKRKTLVFCSFSLIRKNKNFPCDVFCS